MANLHNTGASIIPLISNSSILLFRSFKDRSKFTDYNWYHRHFHVPLFFFFFFSVIWQDPIIFPSFQLLFISSWPAAWPAGPAKSTRQSECQSGPPCWLQKGHLLFLTDLLSKTYVNLNLDLTFYWLYNVVVLYIYIYIYIYI